MASSSTAATGGLRGWVTTELDALGVRDDAVVDYVTGIATEVGRVHRRSFSHSMPNRLARSSLT